LWARRESGLSPFFGVVRWRDDRATTTLLQNDPSPEPFWRKMVALATTLRQSEPLTLSFWSMAAAIPTLVP
jgi:hypothetical protein